MQPLGKSCLHSYSSASGVFPPDRYCCLKETDFCFERTGTKMKGGNIHVSELFAQSSSLSAHSGTPSQHLRDCRAIALCLMMENQSVTFKSSSDPKYVQHWV